MYIAITHLKKLRVEVPSHQSNRNRIVPFPFLLSVCTDKEERDRGTPRIALKYHSLSPQSKNRAAEDAHNLRNGSPIGNPSSASSQARMKPPNPERMRERNKSRSASDNWPCRFLMPNCGRFRAGPSRAVYPLQITMLPEAATDRSGSVVFEDYSEFLICG